MRKETLEEEYNKSIGAIDDFRKNLSEQINNLITTSDIPLGIDLESRVKEWRSIVNKLERKELQLNSVHDLTDLVGVRIILLFKRDLDVVSSLIKNNFDVISEDDKLDSLSDNKFGYQSRHYIIKIPESWLKVPSFSACKDFRAEVQVRTLSQHIWAATSHKLQYKHEESVPVQLRRALNRASAMLEVVDLEFERILIERNGYIDSLNEKSNNNLTQDELLNVDSLMFVAAKYLPPENSRIDEPFDALLNELIDNGITKVDQLIEVIQRTESHWRKDEKEKLAKAKKQSPQSWWTVDKGEDNTEARLKRGVFLTHVGLIRSATKYFFKENGETYNSIKMS